MLASVTAAFLALGLPAQAAKYNCEFQRDGASLKKCVIDSAGTADCQHSFSPNLSGICIVQTQGPDLLICAVTTPVAATAALASGLPRSSAAAAANALAQKPGFLAGGLTIAPTGTGIIAGVYVEKQGAPTLAGVCTP